MSDQERLARYVDVWWAAIDDFTRLLEKIPAEQWSTPTDLAGWDVHACAAHVAHIEAVLSGAPEETIDLQPSEHVTSLTQAYTEQGVVARRDATPDELINEIRESATKRRTFLLTDPPTDATEMPPRTPGDVPWNWETLLRNRPLDVWMHEQDVRRAIGEPGGMDSPAAVHTADYLLEGMAMVLARRAGAPHGSTLVVSVEGHAPAAFGVSDTGRGGALTEVPDQPTVRLAMDRESFVVLAGGRRTPDQVPVSVTGDRDLAARILAGMTMTP